MSRRVITDEIWAQIQNTMQFYGCYRSRNSKTLWKLPTNPMLAIDFVKEQFIADTMGHRDF